MFPVFKRIIPIAFLISVLITTTSLTPPDNSSKVTWKLLDYGFELGELRAPQPPSHGDGLIQIMRIDPSEFKLSIMSAKRNSRPLRTASEWATLNGAMAVVNTGMFLSDGETNQGYMKHFDFVNNPNLTADNAIAAFNPKSKDAPPFQIIDRKCQDWEVLKTKYHSYIQGIRMLDCNQSNRWAQQPNKWSIVFLGEDMKGNVLFIFCRSPYTVHDMVNFVRSSDLGIKKAMYLEGGPEASFYLNYKDTKVEKFGSYETNFNENDLNDHFWPIPNVITVVRK